MFELLVGDPADKNVKRIAKQLSQKQRAKLVPRKPFSGAMYGKCYINSSAYAFSTKATVETGWAVRVSPGLFVEAEQHAVVREESGHLLDVTPHPRGEQTTCFIPSNKMTFSAAGGATLTNRYLVICQGVLAGKVEQLLSIVLKQQGMMISTGSLHYGFNMSERLPELQILLNDVMAERDKK